MIRDIESKIRAVRRRLRVLRFYRGAVWGASIATGLIALAFLVDKAFALPWTTDEKWLAWGALVILGVLVAAIYAIFSRLTLFEAALAADLRRGLQERFSSSILLRDRADDPAVAALLADTHHQCGKLHPRDDFPFLLPRRYAHHLWTLVALLAIYFLVPQMNFLSSAQANQKKNQIVMPKEKRQEQAEKIEKMAKKVKENAEGKENDNLLKFAKDLDKIAEDLKTGENNPRLAMAKMSRVSEEVRLQRNDLSRKFEGYQNLSSPLMGKDTSDLQKALQRNEFDKAAEMARQLAQKAAANSSASDKDQMANDLQNMAQQLSKDQPDMAKAMQQAAQAMKQAAEAQSKGDKSGMKQAMDQAKQAMQQASKAMNDQAQAAQEMAQLDQLQQSMEQQKREMARSMGLASPVGLGEMPGNSQNASASGQSGDQETAQAGQGRSPSGQMGDQMGQGGQNSPNGRPAGDRAGGMQPGGQGDRMGQGQGNQPGQGTGQGGSEFGGQGGTRSSASNMTGQWQPGQTDAQGNGMGGPGRGNGGRAMYDDSNKPGFINTKPPGQKNPGEIIAVMNVDAPALKGESKIQYQHVFTQYKQKADEAMSRDNIPASLQPMVKDYFDAISPEAVNQSSQQNQQQSGTSSTKP